MHLTDYAGLMADIRGRRLVFRTLYSVDAPHHRDRERWRDASNTALAREAMRLGYTVHDSASGDNSVADFAELALECWPPIERSRLWKGYESRVQGNISDWRRLTFSLSWDLRNRLRWRRWRRFGT